MRNRRWPRLSPGMVWKVQGSVQDRCCEMLLPTHAGSDQVLSFHLLHQGEHFFWWLSQYMKTDAVHRMFQLLPARVSWGRQVYVPISVAIYLASAQEARQKMRKYQTVCFMLLLNSGQFIMMWFRPKKWRDKGQNVLDNLWEEQLYSSLVKNNCSCCSCASISQVT